jgi:hypothetical protein
MVDLPKSNIEYKRTEDFQRSYANNVHLLSSNWDLQLIFGEIDQSQGPNTVLQHTAISIPWPQAKVLLYFLGVHVGSHESEFGRIKIPAGIIPAVAGEKPKSLDKVSENSWKELRRQYEEFIKANPESAPK